MTHIGRAAPRRSRMVDEDNDGRFPDDNLAEVRYPRTRQEEQGDRSAWPWLPGSILSQCGPDEWYVCVETGELATMTTAARRRPGRRPGNCSTRAVSGTPARSGAPPMGRSGDPRGGDGQLAVLAGDHRRSRCGLHSAGRDRDRPPARGHRPGYLLERNPGRVAGSPVPRLHDAAQANPLAPVGQREVARSPVICTVVTGLGNIRPASH